jgi:hypothetical protein
MYNEQIENLINMALADGELTEKEKQILFKKAEAAGIDLDEFEMVLEAKLFEKQKTGSGSAAPKSDKLGDVRKCPACGAIAETFATKCGDCGTEFRGVEASQNLIKFFEKLDEIESNRKDSIYSNTDTSNNIGLGTILKWMFFWPFMLPLKIVNFFINKSKPGKWSTTDSRKEELIMNFPVPVSREEILEFLSLATSKINSNTYFNAFSEETKYKDTWNKIWLKKIEQIHSKASIAMKNDKKSFEDVDKMANQARAIVKSNNTKVIHFAILFAVVLVVVIVMAVISSKSEDSAKVAQKGENAKIESLIKSGSFEEADKLILELKDEKQMIEMKSKLQLAQLTIQLDELKPLLDSKDYEKLALELGGIIWTKNSKDYDTESIERESFKTFVKKKEAINNQMPEEFRIDVEAEYSL